MNAGKLQPAYGKLIWYEANVQLPGGLSTKRTPLPAPSKPLTTHYDLFLYPDERHGGLGVLVVRARIKFSFFPDHQPGRAPVDWSPDEADRYMADYAAVVTDVWSGKHLLVPSRVTVFRAIGMMFSVQPRREQARPPPRSGKLERAKPTLPTKDTYAALVLKTQTPLPSNVSGSDTGSDGVLDSLDLKPTDKGDGRQQRPAVHEFGHFLGLRDEYVEPADLKSPRAGFYTPHWGEDKDSVMHSGETVRPRHYALFANWLTARSRITANARALGAPANDISMIMADGGEPIVWKVNGTTDLSNAQL